MLLLPQAIVRRIAIAQLRFRSAIRRGVLVPLLAVTMMVVAAPGARGEPAIPGVVSSQLAPELRGLALIEELNCAACHPGAPSLAARSKKAPRLAEVGARLNPHHLEAFVRDPHGTKPGTTMPDVLGQLGPDERAEAATALTHFLLATGRNDFSLQPPDAVAAQHGHRLFHSRGCAQCHAPRDALGNELPARAAVPLGPLAGRYSLRSLAAFLRQPHASRPSGRMPDLRLPGQDIDRIAHFLLQATRVPGHLAYTLYRGQVWEGLASDEVRAERAGLVDDFALASLGKVEHHTALRYEGWLRIDHPGSHTFFLGLNGGSLSVDGRELLRLEPSDRRGIKSVEAAAELEPGWRRIELTYFHTGHSPKFSFELAGPQFERQAIPSSRLSVSNQPIPAFTRPAVDAALAARGREWFSRFGCANCHDDLRVPARPGLPLARLDASRGCLGEAAGPWPRFGLSQEQRGWITRALPQAEAPRLDDRQQLDKSLAVFNCIACHDRAGLGGIDPARNALFTTTQPALGDQGRLPPPLTHVGAKLKPDWLAGVLLRGQRQRDYVDAAMPQFGEENVGPLVTLFARVDALESAAIPGVTDPEESRKAGHEMIGATGLGCIACHAFNGQKSGDMSAVDLAHVTARLQPNWFHLYLRQPARFHPAVIMPSYWPDGQSTRPNLLGGDSARQIEALWTYLADGPRARKPAGLSRQSSILRVGDVTEICRGQSSIGYRGIAVGYPEGIHLAFDAGEMALRQLWKGEFASVEPGHFSPRGTDRISFPPGIPFHRLAAPDASWPYKGKTAHAFPQDQGYQFRGYHLDAARRPTFLYHYGDIAVADFFEDVRDRDGRAFFRRTLRFDTRAAPAPFHFRAATGKTVTSEGDRNFRLDSLRLRLVSDHRGLVREGGVGEVLILLAPPAGRSTLILEYQW